MGSPLVWMSVAALAWATRLPAQASRLAQDALHVKEGDRPARYLGSLPSHFVVWR